MQLFWVKCDGEVWCGLNTVNLQHAYFNNNVDGVYVIWHGGSNPATVYVGQGIIKDRIAAHRNEPAIQAFNNDGLFVTWAIVDAIYRDGVEYYLATQLRPKVGTHRPVAPIQVNYPW